ncbi:hypothetical protein Slin15195_G001750 [Septoria linicola]|uniref:Uncharacterized protein n=1 Tax=Septoria linicola TaxID=215465 RepID=A0A9Q9AL78_9PEZI|nr:hypothetical protein Slin14017_G001780 [Septoria linicola]USW46856.1 hypothetical protein Slin15195_G001750 [Septoria linicola]
MDWTGGTRRRYAQTGKNNRILAKQKAHFAKARANGKTRSPGSVPDFIREAGGHQLPSASGGSRHLAHIDDRDRSRSSTSAAHGRTHHRGRDAAQRTAPVGRNVTHHAITPDVNGANVPSASTGVTDQEYRLRLNRQRLLARTDWLGLSAARPLKIKFPTNRDKERIGKRRKVERPCRNDGRRRYQRRVTPPFQHRERLLEPMMSGAIVNDDIKIRIGTDAFASQTQQSRKSVTSRNTSMRPPSTEFGPLSEESMLLGEEDAVVFAEFEPLMADHYADATGYDTDETESCPSNVKEAPSDRPLSAMPDLQQWQTMEDRQNYAQNRLLPCVPVASVRQFVDETSKRGNGYAHMVNEPDRHIRGQTAQPSESGHVLDTPLLQPTTRSDRAADILCSQPILVADEDDYEAGIRQRTYSTNSASFKQACAQVSQPPGRLLTQPARRPRSVAMPTHDPGHELVLPQMLLRPGLLQHSILDMSGNRNVAVSIAENPVQHIPELSAQIPEPDTAEVLDNDDEKWARFVLRSRSSVDGSSPFNHKIKGSATQPFESAKAPSTILTSDQPHSDLVTTGHSTAAVHASADSASPSPFSRTQNTSLVGHAATALPVADDIEDDYSPKVKKSRAKSNIYAPARVLNPARFGRRKRIQPAPLPNPDRFLPPSTSVRAVAHKRSVYDLSSNSD